MTLFVIDEEFRKKSGHYYQYNKALIEIFKNDTIEIWANKNVDKEISDELTNIKPYFSGFKKIVPIRIIGALINIFLFWIKFHRELSKLFKQNKNNDVFYLFEMVTFTNFIPIALTTLRYKVKVGLLYRVGLNDFLGYPKILHKVLGFYQNYLIKKLIKIDSCFFTDSEIIKNEFDTSFLSAMIVLPIPNLGITLTNEQVEDKENKFYIYLPGMVRKDKGIDFLLNTLDTIDVKNNRLLDNLVFITQYQNGYEADYCKQLQNRFLRLPVQSIFLGDLTSLEFKHWFSVCDLIIITYDVNCGYNARTSGILADTMEFQKPFITSKNTWMSAQCANYDTGLCVEYGNNAEFVSALEKMITEYSYYLTKAKLAKDNWQKFHSKDNYYNIFVAAIK